MPTAERYQRDKEKYQQWHKDWVKSNREKWNQYQKQRYLTKVGKLTRTHQPTPEWTRQRNLLKSLARTTRAKQARVSWDHDFTRFVTLEAHDLRKRRDSVTNIVWHVDHIIPLKGKLVSGLHVWYNLQVIPKLLNLRKGNKNSLHEKWKTGLQEGERAVQLPSRTEASEGGSEQGPQDGGSFPWEGHQGRRRSQEADVQGREDHQEQLTSDEQGSKPLFQP